MACQLSQYRIFVGLSAVVGNEHLSGLSRLSFSGPPTAPPWSRHFPSVTGWIHHGRRSRGLSLAAAAAYGAASFVAKLSQAYAAAAFVASKRHMHKHRQVGLSDSLNDKAVAIATDRLDAHGRAAIWFYLSRLAIVAHHVAAIDAIHDPAR
jgi:hypothetical protein